MFCVLKIINKFWNNEVCILKQIDKNFKNGIEILVAEMVFKLWIKAVKLLFWSINQESHDLISTLFNA